MWYSMKSDSRKFKMLQKIARYIFTVLTFSAATDGEDLKAENEAETT